MRCAFWLCLVLLAAAGSAIAEPVVLFEQPVDLGDNGIYSEIPGQQPRDDFVLPFGGTITTVGWWGYYNGFDALGLSPMEFSIAFFADDAGSPGAEVFRQWVAASLTDTGLITWGWLQPGNPIHAYEAQLSPTFFIPAGQRAWVSIPEADARTPHVGSTQWLWSRSPSPLATDYAFVLKGNPPAIPAPGAILLGTIGVGLVHSCRKRKAFWRVR